MAIRHHFRIRQAELNAVAFPLPLAVHQRKVFGMLIEIFFGWHKLVEGVYKGINDESSAFPGGNRYHRGVEAVEHGKINIVDFPIPRLAIGKDRFLAVRKPVYLQCLRLRRLCDVPRIPAASEMVAQQADHTIQRTPGCAPGNKQRITRLPYDIFFLAKSIGFHIVQNSSGNIGKTDINDFSVRRLVLNDGQRTAR